MYNIDNTNNIGNMGHLTKEQFTWQFWNMAGITMYLQLPFNSSSHLFYLHDLWESQLTWLVAWTGAFRGGGGWFLHLVSSLDFLRQKKGKWRLSELKLVWKICRYSLQEKNCKMHALIDPFTPKISIVILLTVCYTILLMFVWRIWSWIN